MDRYTTPSMGVGTFFIGLSQISSFFSYYQHLLPAALWNVITRFTASKCFKCHYLPHSSSDCCVLGSFTLRNPSAGVHVGTFVKGMGQISSFLSCWHADDVMLHV